jgi:osmotically-inducible protein OsmY
MNKVSTIMIAVALAAPMYGCHRDEARTTTPDERQEAREERRDDRQEAREDRREEMGDRQEERADDREARRDARDEHSSAEDHQATTGSEPATATAPAAGASGVGNDAQREQEQPRAQAQPTAQDQPMATDDESITLAIRRALVADDAITIRGRNTTIITRGGVVTLRGSVERDAERASVEAHARGAQGVRRVDNQISVSR